MTSEWISKAEVAASAAVLLLLSVGSYSVLAWLWPVTDAERGVLIAIVIFLGPALTAGLLYVAAGGLRPRQPKADLYEKLLGDLGVEKPSPNWWPPRSVVELRRLNRRRAKADGRTRKRTAP